MNVLLLVGFFFSLVFNCYSKVLLFTYAYNRPDFIEIQDKTFKKFLKDDYELVVFNDARDPVLYGKIHDTCNALNLRCLDIPQEIHERPYLPRFQGESFHAPAVRNANVVQYSLDTLGFQHDGIVALFDSDLFLVRDFNISEYLNGNVIAGMMQSRPTEDRSMRISYLWIGLVFIDMSKIEDKETLSFNCGGVYAENGVFASVDTGGSSYYWLQAHPDAGVRGITRAIGPPFDWCYDCAQKGIACVHNEKALREVGLDDAQIAFCHAGLENSEFMEDGIFFHYRAGTNWNNESKEWHEKKTKMLNDYINAILAN